MLVKVLAAGMAVLTAGCTVVGVRSGTEEAPFEVIAQLDEVTEVRRYGERLAVQTSVSGGDSSGARSEAFGRLFKYISGENQPAEKVAMTVPVEMATGAGEDIAMTAPVETAAAEDGAMRMRFFLPGAYTAETAPQPRDPRVSLETVPPSLLAVRRFSGSTGAQAVGRETDRLFRALNGSDFTAAGESFAYFYDPPWTLPPLRRNEVAVPVTKTD